MTNTPNLGLPYIDAAQSQKHVTHNAALTEFDAIVQLSVKQRGLASPPASPGDGDRYIVAAGAAGVWAGRDSSVAAWQDGAWSFYVPKNGWRCYVESEGALLISSGGAWMDAGAAVHTLQNLTALGVGAAADAVNVFSAKLNAALFTAKSPAEGGGGDMRLALNKSAAANTVSQLYQDNYSGRAETGLCGDDHFHIKVSADGAAWREALNVDPATGVVSFPSGVANAGNTLRFGVGAPDSTLGANGDFYIDASNSRLYGPMASGAWPPAFVSLIGPQGQQGVAGARGNSILSYAGIPTAGADSYGVAPLNGDYAMDMSHSRLYGPRAAGAWPASYVALGAAAPPAPQSIVATGGSGGVALSIVAPSSALFASVQIYRAAAGAGFSAALLIASATGASGATLAYADTVASGAYDYYAVSLSPMGAASPPVGPATATVHSPVFAYATGDLRANTTMTASASLFVGTLANMLNGNTSQQSTYLNSATLNGTQWMQWDFGTARPVNEIALFQSPPYSQGVWQAQGSNDAATWANIGAAATLGGAASPAYFTAMNANTAAYRYYRLLSVSGSISSAPWMYQFQFKIGS